MINVFIAGRYAHSTLNTVEGKSLYRNTERELFENGYCLYMHVMDNKHLNPHAISLGVEAEILSKSQLASREGLVFMDILFVLPNIENDPRVLCEIALAKEHYMTICYSIDSLHDLRKNYEK